MTVRRTEQRVVLLQLERLMAYPLVRLVIETGRLSLHGWHYVIEHGEIQIFQGQRGRFYRLPRPPKAAPSPMHLTLNMVVKSSANQRAVG
jgi:carbonic anhydrase